MELTGVKTYTSKIIREDSLSLRVGFLSEASVHHTGLIQLKRGLTSNVCVTDAHYTKQQKKRTAQKEECKTVMMLFRKVKVQIYFACTTCTCTQLLYEWK